MVMRSVKGRARPRRWLEEPGIPYVLAVQNNELLWADTERGAAQVAARELVRQIPGAAGQRLSAGDGSKGPRVYDWSRLPIRRGAEPDQGFWLLAPCLVKGSGIADPNDLAYYACCGAGDVPLAELVRVAGTRWIQAPGGSSKTPSRRPNQRWGWTNTRRAGGSGGTGTLPPCRSTGQALALLVSMPFSRWPGATPPLATPQGGAAPGRTHPTDRA